MFFYRISRWGERVYKLWNLEHAGQKCILSREVVFNEKEMSNLVKYKPDDLKVLYDTELGFDVESTCEQQHADTKLE